MKFAIVLVLSLVALSSVSAKGHGKGHGHGPHGPPGNDTDCKSRIADHLTKLGECLQKNATTYSAFVAALQASSSLSQYVLSENGTQSVNFSALAANYFTTAAPLAAVVAQLGLPFANASQSFANTIDQVQNNRTVLNQFIGVLYTNSLTSFLSGQVSQEVVDFSAVLADANASQLLACFVLEKSHGDHPHPPPHPPHSGERSGENNSSGSQEKKKGKKGKKDH